MTSEPVPYAARTHRAMPESFRLLDGVDRSLSKKSKAIYLAVWRSYLDYCERLAVSSLPPNPATYFSFLQASGPYKAIRKVALGHVFAGNGEKPPATPSSAPQMSAAEKKILTLFRGLLNSDAELVSKLEKADTDDAVKKIVKSIARKL